MNGEIPSVPITTLAGITSLTDLLPEMPLPTPLPHTVNNKSILYHPKVAEDAKKLLLLKDEKFVSQLVNALKQTNTDHVELKDNLAGDTIEGDMPELLKAILAQDSHVFQSGAQSPFNSMGYPAPGFGTRPPPGNGSQFYAQQQPRHSSPYQAGQISPCTPESPARLPQQQSPSAYPNQTSPFRGQRPPSTALPGSGSSTSGGAGGSNFQQQFLQFASGDPSAPTSEHPTVNGSPGVHATASPPHKKQKPSKATNASPAQANAAPAPEEPKQRESSASHSQSVTLPESDVGDILPNDVGSKKKSRAAEPVVVLQPLSSERSREHKKTDRSKHDFLQSRGMDRCHTNTEGEETTQTPQVRGDFYKILDSMYQDASHIQPQVIGAINMDGRQDLETNTNGPENEAQDVNNRLENVGEQSNSETRPNTRDEQDRVLKDKYQMHDLMRSPQIRLTRIEDDVRHKKHKGYGHYTVKTSANDTKITLKLSKSKLPEEKRGTKRRISSDEEQEETASRGSFGDFAPSLSERVKRRRRVTSYRDSGSDDDASVSNDKRGGASDDDYVAADSPVEARVAAPQKRWKEKMKPKRVITFDVGSMSVEERMDTPTFKRFIAAVDSVLENAEEMDLGALDADDEDNSGTAEALVTRSTLSDLVNESAKLKAMRVMNQIPYEKLVKVLTVLQYSIKEGCKVLPSVNADDSREEEEIWRELTMEKVGSAIDASLTAMYIMTSPNMPKEVYVEEVIEKVVSMAKMQLQNTIYPEFDPVYRVDPKGYYGTAKAKRAKAGQVKHRSTLQLYNKLSELVGIMAELIDVQELTDTIILQGSSLSVSPFFVENISELQLNALKLVTSIFSRYDKHRQLIIEDILSSLARLPTSKKNLRSYRLNSEEQIQMVTALVLQLIQSVVKLPTPDEPSDKSQGTEERRSKKANVDKEVVIVTSYETAMLTSHNFLTVFLRKCAIKGEDDYRPLFEHFVYDLLSTVNKPEWPAAELLLSLLGRLLVQQFSNKSVDMSLRVASLDYLGIVASRLRKDAVSSQLKEETVHEIIEQINDSDAESVGSEGDGEKKNKKQNGEEPKDKTDQLQKALLDYLVYNAENDPALVFARQFYIGQWFKDCSSDSVKKPTKKKKVPTATLR